MREHRNDRRRLRGWIDPGLVRPDDIAQRFGHLIEQMRADVLEAQIAFERRKVNGEQWLPARATYSASARVMLVKMMRIGGTLEFSDYRKFSVETDTKIKPQ